MLMGEPVIFVSLNYRMSVWGFLASQEVKDAGIGNIGLQDRTDPSSFPSQFQLLKSVH